MIIQRSKENRIIMLFLSVMLLFVLGILNFGIGIPDYENHLFQFVLYIMLHICFIGMWLYLQLEVCFHSLEITDTVCTYRNIIGKYKKFSWDDIEEIHKKSHWGTIGYIYFKGKNGKIYVKLELDMENAKLLIPYAEKLQQEGKWKGKIKYNYQLKKTNEMPDKLYVKPTLGCFCLAGCYIVGVIIACIGIGFSICEIAQGVYEAYASLICFIMMVIVFLIFVYLELYKNNRKFKNWRMELTTELCSIVDEKGKKIEFEFIDIIDVYKVWEVNKYTSIYICFELKNNNIIKIEYDSMYENMRKVQDFVAYHKRKSFEIDG